MDYGFDAPPRREGYSSVKWDHARRATGIQDILPLWIADMDFPSPKEVVEAIALRAAYPFFGYAKRDESYYEAVMEWFVARHGWRVEREWITHVNGVTGAIATAIRAFTARGDGVVIQSPVYHPFPKIIERAGRRVVDNPLRLRAGRYVPDFDDLRRKMVIDRPKALILCNPHNPVGRVFTREELETLGNICLEFGVIVVSDEIHAGIVYPGHAHVPFTQASLDFARISVVCTAPSKTFSLAGLATANIVIPDRTLRLWFDRESEAVGSHAFNLFGAVACEAAYRNGGPWLDAVLEYLAANIDHAIARLAKGVPSARVVAPEGTYFLWVDLSALGLSPRSLERFLIERARLYLNQGYEFGPGGEGFVRVNIACARSTLDAALDRLEEGVADFARKGFDPGL